MSTLSKRIEKLEQTPDATRAQRIVRALAEKRLNELSDADLMYAIRESLQDTANENTAWFLARGVSEDDIAAIARADWIAVSDDALNKIVNSVPPPAASSDK